MAGVPSIIETSTFLGSERKEAHARHHARAKAVAAGQPFPGPASLEALMANDEAFKNLVDHYRGQPQ